MTERDGKLERAYRGLAREEPPASLDAAILAASRRAVAKPSFTRRWGLPVSLAAMLVLAIGVTLEMRHEQPGVEVAPPETRAPTPMSARSPQELEVRAPEAKREEKAVPSVARPVERPRAKRAPAMKKEQPFAPPPAAAEMRQAPQAAKRAAGIGALQDLGEPLPDPRAELERIAKLRAEGHDEEADRALDEFRRRHPDYRIDEAMWKRVKPR
jgi:hypothetical protein